MPIACLMILVSNLDAQTDPLVISFGGNSETFSEPSDLLGTTEFELGGVSFDFSGSATGGDLIINGNGIGVSGSPNGSFIGAGETVTFTLDLETNDSVLLTEIGLLRGSAALSYDITAGGTTISRSFPLIGSSTEPLTESLDGSPIILTGNSTITISPTTANGATGSMRIQSLTFAAVPEPSMFALAGGLIAVGFTFLHRRKLRASSK